MNLPIGVNNPPLKVKGHFFNVTGVPVYNTRIRGTVKVNLEEEDAEGTLVRHVVKVPLNFGVDTRQDLPPQFAFHLRPQKIKAVHDAWPPARHQAQPSLGRANRVQDRYADPALQTAADIHDENAIAGMLDSRTKTR
eukprot:g5497.t1